MLSYTPINFAEYHWYVKCTCCIILLHQFPAELNFKQSKLILHTFNISNDLLVACPIKIHYVAKSLHKLLKTSNNLAYFARRVCNLNQFINHVIIALLWSSMYEFIGKPVKLYRIMKLHEILFICKSIDLLTIDDRLSEFYDFLNVFAVFLSIYQHKPSWEKVDCLFSNDENKEEKILKNVLCWMDMVEIEMDKILNRRQWSRICIDIINIIKFDILMFLKLYLNVL